MNQGRIGRGAFRCMDVLSVAAAIAILLVWCLPSIDIPLGGPHALRLAGIRNPLLALLCCLLFMRLAYPDRPPWLVRSIEQFGAARPRRRDRRLMLAVVSLLIIQQVFYPATATISGDGVGYHDYVRSAFFDHDLVRNPFSIGPAILWSPFFLAGHLIARVIGAPVDGYSAPYVESVILGTETYACLGIVLIWQILGKLGLQDRRVLTIFGIWFATPFMHYFKVDGSMSHAHSVFTTSLFLYLFVRDYGKQTAMRYVLLGAAGGLVFLTRWQDAVLCVLPAYELARERGFTRKASRALLYGVSAVAVAFPQFVVFKVVYGRWFTVPQGQGFLSLTPTYVSETLFSTNHGLLSWHPLIGLSVIGLAAGAITSRPHVRALAAGFLLQLYVNSTIWQWWAGYSFGGRRFMGCLAIFAVGLAICLAHPRLRGRRGLWVVLAASVFNFLLWSAWRKGLIPPDGVLPFGEFVRGIFSTVLHLPPKDVAVLALATILTLLGWRTSASPQAATEAS